MAKVINITPTQKQGAYADIVTFLTVMGDRYGSATQAAASLLRQTAEYAEWRKANSAFAGRRKRKAG